jgi:hypothetical protein
LSRAACMADSAPNCSIWSGVMGSS